MKDIAFWLKEGLLLLVISPLLILGMLLLVVLVRPLMIIAMVAMLGVFIVSLFRPAVRAWFQAPSRL